MTGEPGVSYVVVLNGALSVLMLVFGWLLNRIFSELDRLREADNRLSEKVTVLTGTLIDRNEFNEHARREEIALSDLRASVNELVAVINDVKLLLARHVAATTGAADDGK